MFTADDIQRRIRSQPFRPVRIITSSGQAYDVTHPELVMVGRRALVIGTPSNENAGIFEVENHVSLMHVTDLQEIPTSKTVGGNGAG